MQALPPTSPLRLIIRKVRRVYRPFLIRPAHAYFFPALLRAVPRRLRIARLQEEQDSDLSTALPISPDSHRFPL
ncbi:MAG: hypothetical protein ACOYXO_14010 [Chloroflexota bacterium]|uniref:Uncharacterized protein n=1 Tax=Bellilinea caldifistulae TaxID=360411 RepID=A0A7C4Q2N0_9CHLR